MGLSLMHDVPPGMLMALTPTSSSLGRSGAGSGSVAGSTMSFWLALQIWPPLDLAHRDLVKHTALVLGWHVSLMGRRGTARLEELQRWVADARAWQAVRCRAAILKCRHCYGFSLTATFAEMARDAHGILN